jgi:phage terminase small subunit
VRHKGVLDIHTNQVNELYTRTKASEEAITILQKETTRLEFDKTDLKTFLRVKKKLECQDLVAEIGLFKANNHCITLDNYLEKYVPIRTQGLINETLRSILGGKERRRLELYDNEKNSLLY